ncbi:hypothetical protein M9H77_32186 [Catharanthus roseus]|uniref:Uncharacterized protein n=1 Tax=Catharanthus roseus TaxID=4058 RepID=A0ACC0A2J3_CATRO|nr:hypothetical protein M9H77_32186 [Catharanthus roseus]
MLNYKKHSSKSSHARPDENLIGMFFCMFLTLLPVPSTQIGDITMLFLLADYKSSRLSHVAGREWAAGCSQTMCTTSHQVEQKGLAEHVGVAEAAIQEYETKPKSEVGLGLP